MENESVKCPVCGGIPNISSGELIRVLSDKDVLKRLQAFVSELSRPKGNPEGAVVVGAPAPDFEQQVHSWNPENPMWRRSNKE